MSKHRLPVIPIADSVYTASHHPAFRGNIRGHSPRAAGGDALVAAIGELQQAFTGYAESHTRRLDAVSVEVAALQTFAEDLSRQIAGVRVGGAGDGAPARDGNWHRNARVQAFTQWVRSGSDIALAQAAMQRDSNPDGGFLIPEEVEQEIGRLARDTSAMRRLARVIPTTSAEWKKHLWAGTASAGWVSETGARPETATPPLAELSFPAHELYANPKLTNLVLQDARVNLAEEIVTEITEAFRLLENVAWITGTGNNQPRGLLSYPITSAGDKTRPLGTLQYVPSLDATSFPAVTAAVSPVDSLINVQTALRTEYRQNASWLMNSATAGVVRKFKKVDGSYAWEDSNKAGTPPTLLGHAVEYAEDMPDVGANAFPIAFGDFRAGYYIIERAGISVLRDPYTLKGWTQFYTTKRVGGGVFNSEAIKLLKIAVG
jgi:HK97 family phage major capsid protein